MANNPPPKPPAKGGKGGSLTKNPKVLAGAAAAGVVVVFALIKRGNTASSDTSGTTTAGTATYDSTATDQYNGIADQLYALQQQIGAITQGAAGTTGTTTTGTTTGTTSKPVITKLPPISKPVVTLSPTKPGLPAAKAKPKTPAVSFKTVTVQHGDTLSKIAAKYHESLSTLLKDNPTYTRNAKYKNGNMIWAGDHVKVR